MAFFYISRDSFFLANLWLNVGGKEDAYCRLLDVVLRADRVVHHQRDLREEQVRDGGQARQYPAHAKGLKHAIKDNNES